MKIEYNYVTCGGKWQLINAAVVELTEALSYDSDLGYLTKLRELGPDILKLLEVK